MTITHKAPKWISGPNPHHHRMYVAYGYHRVTSRLRGEIWNLTWPEWRDAWLPVWDQRGRSATQLCMCRKDIVGVWEISNIQIITRRQHGKHIRAYYK